MQRTDLRVCGQDLRAALGDLLSGELGPENLETGWGSCPQSLLLLYV